MISHDSELFFHINVPQVVKIIFWQSLFLPIVPTYVILAHLGRWGLIFTFRVVFILCCTHSMVRDSAAIVHSGKFEEMVHSDSHMKLELFRADHLDEEKAVINSILVSFAPTSISSISATLSSLRDYLKEGVRGSRRMACLNVLKAEIKILEATFSKSHER